MTDFIVFLSLAILSFYVGWRKTVKIQNDSDYLLAGRKTGLLYLSATLIMTEFNPTTLIAFSDAGYYAGLWGISLSSVFLIGLLFYTFTAAEKWKELNAVSVAELFTAKYGKMTGKTASLFLIIAMLGFSANYIKSAEIIFSPVFTGIPPYLVSFLFVFIICIIILRGGLVSIIRIDMMSFIGLLIFIPLLLVFSAKTVSGNIYEKMWTAIPVSEGQKVLPVKFVFSLIVLTSFTYIAAPWYGQKIFSADSKKTAFRAVSISAAAVFLLYAFPAVSVYMLRISGVRLDNSQSGIPYIVNSLFPAGFRGFGFFMLFAAGATTLAGVWNAVIAMIKADFLDGQELSLRKNIFLTLTAAFITWILSVTFIDRILDKLILANIPVAALSFALLAGFYWKRVSRTGALASLAVGLVSGTGCYLYFGEKGMYTWYWAVYSIPSVFLIGIIFSLIFPDSADIKYYTKHSL